MHLESCSCFFTCVSSGPRGEPGPDGLPGYGQDGLPGIAGPPGQIGDPTNTFTHK